MVSPGWAAEGALIAVWSFQGFPMEPFRLALAWGATEKAAARRERGTTKRSDTTSRARPRGDRLTMRRAPFRFVVRADGLRPKANRREPRKTTGQEFPSPP